MQQQLGSSAKAASTALPASCGLRCVQQHARMSGTCMRQCCTAVMRCKVAWHGLAQVALLPAPSSSSPPVCSASWAAAYSGSDSDVAGSLDDSAHLQERRLDGLCALHNHADSGAPVRGVEAGTQGG